MIDMPVSLAPDPAPVPGRTRRHPARGALAFALAAAVAASTPAAARKKKTEPAEGQPPAATTAESPEPAPTPPVDEGGVIADLAAQQAKHLAAAASDKGDALGKLVQAGGLEASTMTEPGAVEARLALLEEWCRRSEELSRMLAGSGAELEAGLAARGVTSQTAASFVERLSTSPARVAMAQARVQEAQTCLLAREQLQLLAAHPWRWDDEGQHVVFTDPSDGAAAKRHAELGGQLAAIGEAAAREAAAHQAAAEAAAAKQGP